MAALRRAAAFFDLDGTLLPYTSCDRELVRALRAAGRLAVPALLRAVAYELRASRHGPSAMWGVRGYLAGWPHDEFARFCADVAQLRLVPRLAPLGLKCLKEHRERGDFVVLMTGAPAQLAEPLGDLLHADLVIAGFLDRQLDALTGWLGAPTPRGREKARQVRAVAAEHDLDLAASWAYANTWDDVPHMAMMGNPIAVNPGPLLVRAAARRGWPIVLWGEAAPAEEVAGDREG